MSFDPLKLEYQLCFRLYAASRNMTRIYQPILDRHGITYPQYIVLLILFEHESIDFKELSQMVDLKTGTLTPIIQKLEEYGFITKEKNPKDGRRINVDLTSKGKELKQELAHVPIDLASKIGLEKERYFTLTTELDNLLNKLYAAQQEGISVDEKVNRM
jgi:DNA-binding MarR family transcriptional regulator